MSKIKKFFNCVIAGKEKPTKAELRNSIIVFSVSKFNRKYLFLEIVIDKAGYERNNNRNEY